MNGISPLRAKNSFRYRWLFTVLLFALLALGTMYVTNTWSQYLGQADEVALGLAQSASQFLSTDLSTALVGDLSNSASLEYQLTRFVQHNNQIERAYLYSVIDEKILPLTQSEASILDENPFQILDTQALVSEPQILRRNDFVSALVPVKHSQTAEIIAILGVDFLADEWYKEASKHVIHAFIVMTSIALLCVTCYWLMKKNRELQESERSKAVFLAHLPGMAYRCKNDKNWTMLFVSEGCQALTGYSPENLVRNKDISYYSLIGPEHQEILRNEWERVLATRTHFRAEYQIVTAAGGKKWVLEMGQGIYDRQGEVQALEGLIIDITEQKVRGEKIQYMNDHDLLTGLHNRRFFEQEKKRLAEGPNSFPLSIIVADINGLKLINDAFGHKAGDQLLIETANIIQASCRTGDIVARTAGDEFRILLPNTTGEMAQEISERILSSCATHNANSAEPYSINVSLALGVTEDCASSIDEVENETEETLYQRKLLSRASSHSTILSSIMATLYARSQETEEHARRLAELSNMVGRKLHLPQRSLDELELFAMLHDVGKVGIDDRVLNKPGKLDEEEWALMQKHPEIGHRIAMSSSELESIAPYILTHHERWDGAGYPQGLKGEEIPLLSRILAVVDAYDAMTEDRIYRKAMSKETALNEIEKNAGTQFDPQIAKIFVGSMRTQNEL